MILIYVKIFEFTKLLSEILVQIVSSFLPHKIMEDFPPTPYNFQPVRTSPSLVVNNFPYD